MPYLQRTVIRRPPVRRRALMGFGAFDDNSPCSSIPAGDPYRKPGNYCATADGGFTTFNTDGSVYVEPAGTTATASPNASVLDKIGTALSSALGQRPIVAPGMPIAAPIGGMSTTTKVALAGGAVLLLVLLTRR
jgi:hypothetical protein